MEVAGLLHDLGKLSNGFIKKSAQDTPTGFSYDYELIADPNTAFLAVAKSDSQRVNEMQKKAAKTNRHSLFKYRPDITNYLQSQSFQSWDSQSYNLAEVLLGQFASQDLA